MDILFLFVQIGYAGLTLLLWQAWQQTPVFRAPNCMPAVKISVVVVVRNEATHIPALLQSLATQTYPADQYDVWIADDFSTDHTVAVVKAFAERAPFALHVLELKEYLSQELTDGSYKKKAIELAVKQAAGELIVTTDGDCVVPPQWLSCIARFYQQTRAQLICGAVTFLPEKTIFARLQTIEFASLIGSGAATLRLGVPTMCNAANLAFTRQAFLAVDGYQHTADTATGDDLFLMHKIHQHYPSRVRFLRNVDAVVHTHPQATLRAFYQQRKRWASKWNLYPDKRPSLLAMFIFLANLLLLLGLLAVFLHKLSPLVWVIGVAVRWVAEWLFLAGPLHCLGKRRLVGWIPVVQCVYPLYVLFFGLAVQRRGYQWKGRRLH